VESRQTFGIAPLNTNCVTKLVMEKNVLNVLRCEWAFEGKGKTWHNCVGNTADVQFSYTFCINTSYITNNKLDSLLNPVVAAKFFLGFAD